MSDLISIVVLFILFAGMFKMFGRYLAGMFLFAALAAIIGAIFTKGLWETFAQWGALVGFIVSFIIFFREAWRTFLGAFIGALIGVGIGLLIPNNETMWEADIVLALLLFGAALASSQAAADLFEESTSSSSSRSRRVSESDSPKPEPFIDGMGNKHEKEPVCRCRECVYYLGDGMEEKCSAKGGWTVHGSDYACAQFSMW